MKQRSCCTAGAVEEVSSEELTLTVCTVLTNGKAQGGSRGVIGGHSRILSGGIPIDPTRGPM